MDSGEWQVKSEEWRVESEEWRVKSKKVKIGKYLTILADFWCG